MGQCALRPSDGADEFATHAVCVERAKSLSSNAAVTAARYHYPHAGRRLADDYNVTSEVLGNGLCGDVVLALSRFDDKKYALKAIAKTQVAPPKLQQLTAEVEIYLALDHPNIARLHDVYETDANICLLTECCVGGELYFRLQERGAYTDADAAEASRQMLRAVGYLHSHRVVHRDLKLENFLYENESEAAQLKLIDFGFAKIWDPTTLMMATCGSIAYVSPDVLSGQGYTNKCDIWSIGVIVWMLLAGYPPFHGSESHMMQQIRAGDADWSHRSRWASVSEQAVDFVKRLMTKAPNDRPSAQEALQHPWLVHSSVPTSGVSLDRDALRSLRRYADASRLRRAILQLLVQELGPDETTELRETFLAIDRTNEGTICLRDLKDAIRGGGGNPTASRCSPLARRRSSTSCVDSAADSQASFGYQSIAPSPFNSGISICSGNSPTTPARSLRRANSAQLDDLFAMLDANGDERIYYSDFLAAALQGRNRLREEAVRAAFRRLDADGSGSISVQDVRTVLGETFEGVDAEEVVREASLLLAQAVGPEVAASGEISFDAFLRVLEDHDAVPSPAPSPSRKVFECSRESKVSFFPKDILCNSPAQNPKDILCTDSSLNPDILCADSSLNPAQNSNEDDEDILCSDSSLNPAQNSKEDNEVSLSLFSPSGKDLVDESSSPKFSFFLEDDETILSPTCSPPRKQLPEPCRPPRFGFFPEEKAKGGA